MRRPAWLAIALVVVSCGLGVIQGLRNQSGDQTGLMALQVGVQAIVRTDAENSGSWVVLRSTSTGAPRARGQKPAEYFDAAKVAELGFDPAKAHRAVTRLVFVVLERVDAMPLQVVDAGLDGPALQARYPDRSRYPIARAPATNWPGRETVTIGSLVSGELHVPAGMAIGREILVRSGQGQIPYVVSAPR